MLFQKESQFKECMFPVSFPWKMQNHKVTIYGESNRCSKPPTRFDSVWDCGYWGFSAEHVVLSWFMFGEGHVFATTKQMFWVTPPVSARLSWSSQHYVTMLFQSSSCATLRNSSKGGPGCLYPHRLSHVVTIDFWMQDGRPSGFLLPALQADGFNFES